MALTISAVDVLILTQAILLVWVALRTLGYIVASIRRGY